MKIDIKHNVKIGHDGLVYQYQAGVHEDVPVGVAEALIKDGLAVEVKAEQAPDPEKAELEPDVEGSEQAPTPKKSAPKKTAAKVEE